MCVWRCNTLKITVITTKYSSWQPCCLKFSSPVVTISITRFNVRSIYLCSTYIFRYFQQISKMTNSFVMSVGLSVRPTVRPHGTTRFHWSEFRKIWYQSIFRKSAEKIPISLKPDKNNGHFAWRPQYTYDNISLSSSHDDKSFRQML